MRMVHAFRYIELYRLGSKKVVENWHFPKSIPQNDTDMVPKRETKTLGSNQFGRTKPVYYRTYQSLSHSLLLWRSAGQRKALVVCLKFI
jgi:hypothetical protein